MNRNKLIIRTGDIYWCRSIRKNFHIKTRPFLVVENKETYILALALTSNLSNKEIVLHQYALSKDSAVLFNNLYRINKKGVSVLLFVKFLKKNLRLMTRIENVRDIRQH